MIASHLAADARLARVADRCAGLRVPGAFDGFELVVRAILGQRVSVRAATTLAGRLAARLGEPIETPFAGLNRLSPTPARLADAAESELRALGISGRARGKHPDRCAGRDPATDRSATRAPTPRV